MPPRWEEILDTKLAQLFPAAVDRSAANALLAPVLAGPEGPRVAVGCLKLAGNSLKELKACTETALTDYRDILAWAEYPRQMQLGVKATPEQKTAARRADTQEYTRWLEASGT